MEGMSAKARWKLPFLLGVAAVLVAALFAILGGGESPPAEVSERPVVVAPSPAPAPPPPPSPMAPVAASGSPEDELDALLQVPAAESSEEPRAEYPVKMEELRARLPGNLYWELDAPTKDPQVLQRRAETQRKWNELFGKVQSGDATEEEIHRYYDHRRKLSEDYLAVANLMLTEYGDQLPERDKGLLGLSIQMHQDRLKAVPRQVEEALARKQLQDQRREEWIRNGKKP
jgi:hypothetical protein